VTHNLDVFVQRLQLLLAVQAVDLEGDGHLLVHQNVHLHARLGTVLQDRGDLGLLVAGEWSPEEEVGAEPPAGDVDLQENAHGSGRGKRFSGQSI
jgi:hypothetical protein